MPDEEVFSDRYQLVRHIARGGMAQVYLARDLLLGRPVALKVLFPELSVDRAFVERFRREAQAAANLTHPNIVSVYDWGQGDRTYFIVMEYVDGQTLSQLIRASRDGVAEPIGTQAVGSMGAPVPALGSPVGAAETSTPPLGSGRVADTSGAASGALSPAATAAQDHRPARISPQRTAEIGAQVAAALDFAHRHGVIHRDVKPGNVLLDTAGNVKVTDFGIARAIGTQEGLTQTGAVMGTATYFSPEQAQGFAVDARSDVYSLGVVLYEMAVGHAPFAGENPLAIAYKHVRQDPVPPTTENQLVPPALEAIILKAMAKSPEARYQTAEELRADLERFRAGVPVLAEADVAGHPTAVQHTVTDPTAVAAAAVGAYAGAAGASTLVGGPDGDSINRVPSAYERRSRRRLWAALAVAALIAAAVGLFFGGRAAGWWGSTAKTVAIPTDVVGKSQAAAETELRRLGFSHFATDQASSPTVDAGQVATTRPAPGTPARTDHTVTLVLSSGPGSANVPNVVNQAQAQATAALQQAGFKVTTTQAASTTVPQGNVISQTPSAGQPAAKGSTVQLVISTGLPQVTIPSLVGQDPATAGSKLAALGLSVTQQDVSSSSIQSGRVTGTNPAAGTPVSVGTTVTVFVSTGKQQVNVPNVVGSTQAQAAAALSAAGLQATFSTQPVTQPAQNGVVLSQNPSSGQVAQGSTVSVVVGAFTAPPTSPPSSAPTSTTAASPTTT